MCGGSQLEVIVSLEEGPITGHRPDASRLPERFPAPVPLTLVSCPRCTLVQIREIVAPDILLAAGPTRARPRPDAELRQVEERAGQIMTSRRLHRRSLVVQIGDHERELLDVFAARGVPTRKIGFAPEPAQAEHARALSMNPALFDQGVARRLRDVDGRADVVIVDEVLTHAVDLNRFVEGIDILLAESGMAVIEVPYLFARIDGGAFDSISHRHSCYFSLTSLMRLCRRHGLFINHAEQSTAHGGSLRVLVHKYEAGSASLQRLLCEEMACDSRNRRPGAYAARLRYALPDTLQANEHESLADMPDQGLIPT